MGEAGALLRLVDSRRGHFVLESGYHTDRWLDLDLLLANHRAVAPFVSALTTALRPHDVQAVCGPMVGGAFLAQLVAAALEVEFYFSEPGPPQGGGLYRATYRFPGGAVRRLRGKRVALVDDVMSAGSSLLATHVAATAHGATTAVVGALLVLGREGDAVFAREGIPVAAPARGEQQMWTPAECPLCAAGEAAVRPA